MPEPFVEELLRGEGHEAKDAFVGIKHEEEAPEALPNAKEGAENHPISRLVEL